MKYNSQLAAYLESIQIEFDNFANFVLNLVTQSNL